MNKETSSTQSDVTVERADADTVIAIGTINEYLPSPLAPVEFSMEGAPEVSTERTQATKDLFVGDERLIESALADLEKHHIVLLAGKHGCEISTLAIYLGTRIAGLRSTLVVSPLDRNIHIDLVDLAAHDKHLVRRVTIFANVLGRHNHDLCGFFAHSEAARWEQLTNKLRTKRAYLIFTAEPEAVANAAGIVCHQVPPLTPEQVGLGLDKRVHWLETRPLCEEHVRALKHNRDRLLGVLKTLPRVARFLDRFIQGPADLDAALQRFNDIPFWFSTDLAGDIDAWCFALTLALAHAARPASGIGWYELERIRRAVTERIKSDAELFHRRAEAPGGSLSDDALLYRGHAEITKDPSRLGDSIRFTDPSYAAKIWETLAARHRRVLTALLPALRSVAENEQGAAGYGVRSLAAQMIGRIGELDPHSISIPLVQRDWIGARDLGQRPLVGRLVQGMRASSNEAYRRAALGAVDALTMERPGDNDGNRDRLLTAISCFALLGERELDLAMERLGAIATESLAPAIASRHQLERLAAEFDERLSRTDSQQSAEDLLAYRLRLGRLANRLGEQHATTLLALKQAVVYLCLTNDCIQVLWAMHKWVVNEPTGTLVAILFLHGGIAEELHALAGGKQSNLIVQSLAVSADAVEKFSVFLAEICKSIHRDTLPDELQRELQKRIAAQLTEWEDDAAGNPVRSAAVQALRERLVPLTGDASCF